MICKQLRRLRRTKTRMKLGERAKANSASSLMHVLSRSRLERRSNAEEENKARNPRVPIFEQFFSFSLRSAATHGHF